MAGVIDALSVRGTYTFGCDGTPVPDRGMVVSVARALHQNDGGVGYAVFDDLDSELGPAAAKEFQISLINSVWDEMMRRGWSPCAGSEVRLNRFNANDGSLPVEVVGEAVTYKKLHFDPHSILFAHLYEAPVNLSGGAISLVNVRAYLDATGSSFDAVFRPSRRPGHELRMVARDEHRQILLSDYARVVMPPDPGHLLLVMVRNDPVVGVAHEIAAVRTIDPAEPITRRFFRTSIAPHH